MDGESQRTWKNAYKIYFKSKIRKKPVGHKR